MEWKSLIAEQQPDWQGDKLNSVKAELKRLPALVFAGEIRKLKRDLHDVSRGQAFIVQIGDCAEEFDRCNGAELHKFLKVLFQFSNIVSYLSGKRVINIGRIAGQYAKPRSSNFEIKNEVRYPAYRGDMVNSSMWIESAREHNPERMLKGYFHSAATLNLLRAFVQGGYGGLDTSENWLEGLSTSSSEGFSEVVQGLKSCLKFIKANNVGYTDFLNERDYVYTSHEALLLDYEECLTRVDSLTDENYATSGHFLWIGDRTRQLDGAHVAYCQTILNPIGLKIGPSMSVDDFVSLVEKLNPENVSNRLVLIFRLGAQNIEAMLPLFISVVKARKFNVIWMCDPMHGNTYTAIGGIKTRNTSVMLRETEFFINCLIKNDLIPGGIHLEATGGNVTECVDDTISFDETLEMNYQSVCDPRLNYVQTLEFAFQVGKLLKED
jgi:3-deoxy-7-phosphoheptulonate synthase